MLLPVVRAAVFALACGSCAAPPTARSVSPNSGASAPDGRARVCYVPDACSVPGACYARERELRARLWREACGTARGPFN